MRNYAESYAFGVTDDERQNTYVKILLFGAIMVKIGSREVISSHTLQIPIGEVATIALAIDGWELEVRVTFDDEKPEQGAAFQAEGPNAVRIVFYRWDNVLGSSLRSPVAIAGLNSGKDLEFMATNFRIGDMNLLQIQFMTQRGQ